MKILIVGLGKSGSTWIASSLAKSLAIEYFNEPEATVVQQILEREEACVVKQVFGKKEHIEDFYDRFDVIYNIERDPLDAAVSLMLWSFQVSRQVPYLLLEKVYDPTNTSILSLLPYQHEFHNHGYFRQALSSRRNVHTVQYERIVAGDFSGFGELAGQFRSFPLEGDVGKRKFRSGTPGNWRKWLTSQDAVTVKAYLTEKGFGSFYSNWELSNDPITLDETIGYLLKRHGNLSLVREVSSKSLQTFVTLNRSRRYRLYRALHRRLVGWLNIDQDVLEAKWS